MEGIKQPLGRALFVLYNHGRNGPSFQATLPLSSSWRPRHVTYTAPAVHARDSRHDHGPQTHGLDQSSV